MLRLTCYQHSSKAMTQLLVLVLATKAMVGIDYDVIDMVDDSLAIIIMGWLGILLAFQEVDSLFFDIPPEEEAALATLMRAKNLRIDDLSDMATLKMTHFNWCQLSCLYMAFDIEGQLEPMSMKLTIPTGHFFNGSSCCYRVHLEEVFLFTLCRLAMSMTKLQIIDAYIGDDINRWTYAYPWMLKHLDERYSSIICHQSTMA